MHYTRAWGVHLDFDYFQKPFHIVQGGVTGQYSRDNILTRFVLTFTRRVGRRYYYYLGQCSCSPCTNRQCPPPPAQYLSNAMANKEPSTGVARSSGAHGQGTARGPKQMGVFRLILARDIVHKLITHLEPRRKTPQHTLSSGLEHDLGKHLAVNR